MDYKVLYRKYRPHSFEDLVGQEFVESILKSAIINNKLAHAYLFSGPKGTGKTSMARLFSKSINCVNNVDGNPCCNCSICLNYEKNPDIIEIDAASNNGVDEMRELRENVKVMPTMSKYKIYIIDEVHMLSNSAFNALLKTLEEPPEHVIFIFATTDVQKMPSTVLSRCQRFDFKKINSQTIAARLEHICDLENIKCDEDSLKEISILADGSLRDALGLLDQLSTVLNNKIDIKGLSKILKTIPHDQFDLLYKAIFDGSLSTIDEIFNECKSADLDTTAFLNDFINYLIKIAKNKDALITNNNISFDKLKNLIFSLNNLLIENKSIINLFDIIQLEVLTLVEKYSEQQPLKLEKDFVIEKTPDISNHVSSDDGKDIDSTDTLLKNVAIRVNNCMAAANKNLKTEMKKLWKSFCDTITVKDLSTFNLIVGSNVEAVSENIILLSCQSESQAMLFNEQHLLIENKFNNNYKIVCLSIEKWAEEKERFIKDKENNIKWTIIDELVEIKPNKRKSKIETIASDVFDDVDVVID